MVLRLRLGRAEWIGAAAAAATFIAAVLTMSGAQKIHLAPTEAAAPVKTVIQHNRHFYPDRLTIARGTVVDILNKDYFIHHVYVKSPFMAFDSGDDPIGASVNVEFDHPGTYDVQCAIHPLMHLWVTVK